MNQGENAIYADSGERFASAQDIPDAHGSIGVVLRLLKFRAIGFMVCILPGILSNRWLLSKIFIWKPFDYNLQTEVGTMYAQGIGTGDMHAAEWSA